jgi:ABC-type amino acid transport substrate-binding protein
MIRLIFGDAGYLADIRIYPSARVRALVSSGDLDASIAARFWDIDGIVLFSEEPFGEPKIALFWGDGASDVTSLAQLDGKVVIVPLGQFTPVALLRQKAPHAILEQPRDFAAAIAMLTKGRADYLLDWQNPVQSELDRLGLRLKHLDLPPEYTYVVISRRVPDATTVIHRIDAEMRRLAAEGKLPMR